MTTSPDTVLFLAWLWFSVCLRLKHIICSDITKLRLLALVKVSLDFTFWLELSSTLYCYSFYILHYQSRHIIKTKHKLIIWFWFNTRYKCRIHRILDHYLVPALKSPDTLSVDIGIWLTVLFLLHQVRHLIYRDGSSAHYLASVLPVETHYLNLAVDTGHWLIVWFPSIIEFGSLFGICSTSWDTLFQLICRHRSLVHCLVLVLTFLICYL